MDLSKLKDKINEQRQNLKNKETQKGIIFCNQNSLQSPEPNKSQLLNSTNKIQCLEKSLEKHDLLLKENGNENVYNKIHQTAENMQNNNEKVQEKEKNKGKIAQLDYDILEKTGDLESLEKKVDSKIKQIKHWIDQNKIHQKQWINNFNPQEIYDLLEKHAQQKKEEELKKDIGELVGQTNISANKFNSTIKEISSDRFKQSLINIKDKNTKSEEFEEKIQKLSKFTNLSDITYEFKCEELYIWFHDCFDKWTKEISHLNSNETNPLEARTRVGVYQQSKKFLKPLLTMINEKTVRSHVVDKLFEVMIYCANKDYIKSNQKYYELAIGTGAWPKGDRIVTVHSKHSEKINKPSDIAYIMNDETTKRYLLAIKRVISTYQRLFPKSISQCVVT